MIIAGAMVFAVSCKKETNKVETNNNTTITVDSANAKGEAKTFDVSVAKVTNKNGQTLETTFNPEKENVTIVFMKDTMVLKQQPSASGIRYSDKNYEYCEWQGEVELKKNGKTIFMHKPDKNTVTEEKFVSNDGKELKAVYKTEGKKPIVTIDYEGYKEQVLTQTTAWAKGGEYCNKTMKWTTKPDGATLKVDGKTIQFKSHK